MSFTVNAQKITGIWRGYFSSSSGIYREGTREETYKYEIQIDQQTNNGLKGVTYSYKSTVFYGKAELHGIFTAASKSIIIKETKLVDLKIGDKSEPCLMTCYLDYSKIGKLEVLEGTFISINVKDKSDCGSGKVYLERVATSDFKKEDFLLKKKDDILKDSPKIIIPQKPLVADKNKPVIKPQENPVTRRDNLAVKPIPLKPNVSVQQKPATGNIPGTTPPVIKKPDTKVASGKNKLPVKEDKPLVLNRPQERIQEEPANPKKEEPVSVTLEAPVKKMPVPRILMERENSLVKTITTAEEYIQIDLYDGGIIDNDTISVYHNNELVVTHGRLSLKPITLKIKCSKTDSHHEIIIVAENLGDIPPNTASMVFKAGKDGNKERQEITITSTEQRNAKVIINYVPKE
jgi:hypothetical protein